MIVNRNTENLHHIETIPEHGSVNKVKCLDHSFSHNRRTGKKPMLIYEFERQGIYKTQFDNVTKGINYKSRA